MANDPELVIKAVRVSWLMLCGMMIFSRFVFQAAGPVFMREFLDTWKVSRTHRLWGGAALIYGIALLVLSLRAVSSFSLGEHFLVWSLIFILAADGLLNLVPSWFGNFKERMQEAWVSRRSKSMAPPDPGLFLWVNIALAVR